MHTCITYITRCNYKFGEVKDIEDLLTEVKSDF